MSHAFDTNILVYAMMAQDPAKLDMAFTVMQDAIISVQVIAEFTALGRRKFKQPMDMIDASIADLALICDIRPLTPQIAKSARRITDRYKLPYYDAQIIAAALDAGCTTLYSEDGQHGQEIENLKLLNPFV